MTTRTEVSQLGVSVPGRHQSLAGVAQRKQADASAVIAASPPLAHGAAMEAPASDSFPAAAEKQSPTPNLALGPYRASSILGEPGVAGILLLAVWLLALAACGSRPLATGGDLSGPVLTPSGALALYPHSFGSVLPWHIETAEASWQHVAPCVGVGLGALRGFPVLLASGPVACGDIGERPGCSFLDAHPRIEIIGASWDFDPAHPEASPGPTAEIGRLWRHELVHVALWKLAGDPDGAHARPEWRCER